MATGTELGDHVGEVLAERFLYPLVVQPYAQRLLRSAADERGNRPGRSQ